MIFPFTTKKGAGKTPPSANEEDAQGVLKKLFPEMEYTLRGYVDAVFSESLYAWHEHDLEKTEQELAHINERISGLQIATDNLEEEFEKMKKGIAVRPKAREHILQQEKTILDQLENLLRIRTRLQKEIQDKKRSWGELERARFNIAERATQRIDKHMSPHEENVEVLKKNLSRLKNLIADFDENERDLKSQYERAREALAGLKDKPPEERTLFEWKINALEERVQKIEELLQKNKKEKEHCREKQRRFEEHLQALEESTVYWTNVRDIFSKIIQSE